MARARPSGKEKIFTHFMQAPDFELTHNRDNSYPAVAPHYHEFYELIFFLSGHVSYIVGDRSMKLEPGDMLIIPPNTLHNPIFEDFRQSYDRYVLWVSPAILEQLERIDSDLLFFTRRGIKRRYLLRPQRSDFLMLNDCFARLELCLCQSTGLSAEPSQRRGLWHPITMGSIILLLSLYNQSLLANDEQTQLQPEHLPISEVLSYLHEHLSEDLSLESVAASFFMSRFSLAHLFKKYCGVSFYQYLLRQRLVNSKELLLQGVSAKEAALSSGFKDYSNFYRAFLKEYEITPQTYKRLAAEKRNAVPGALLTPSP